MVEPPQIPDVLVILSTMSEGWVSGEALCLTSSGLVYQRLFYEEALLFSLRDGIPGNTSITRSPFQSSTQ